MVATVEGMGWAVTEGTGTAVKLADRAVTVSEETGREETGTEVKVEVGVYSIVT